MRGDDERRAAGEGGNQAGGDEEVRVHDVRPRRGEGPPRQRQVAELPARARVEDGQLDLVASRDELPLDLRDERPEVGRSGAWVHLRDEQDAHGASVRGPRATSSASLVRGQSRVRSLAWLPRAAAGELTSVLTSNDQRYLTEGFVITEGGRYRGLGTREQLVRAVTEARIEASRHANLLATLAQLLDLFRVDAEPAREPRARQWGGEHVVHLDLLRSRSGDARAPHPQHEAEGGEREQDDDQCADEEAAPHQIEAATAAEVGWAGT